MNTLKFTKMHSLGNDFIVIDGTYQSVKLSKEWLQYFSDRHRGIGFDQCLLIEPPLSENTDFFYRIFNANGSEVGQCGNGARCVARFIHEQGLSSNKIYKLATKTTELTVEIQDNDYQKIRAELGIPQFISSRLEKIKEVSFHAVDLGNPHAVIHVEKVKNASVETISEAFKAPPFLSLFPEGVNVGFMEIQNNQALKLRVFERGAGETQACGSGACAAMICARKFYHTNSVMTVELLGGLLEIQWESEGFPVSVTGNAVHVFDGVVPFNGTVNLTFDKN